MNFYTNNNRMNSNGFAWTPSIYNIQLFNWIKPVMAVSIIDVIRTTNTQKSVQYFTTKRTTWRKFPVKIEREKLKLSRSMKNKININVKPFCFSLRFESKITIFWNCPKWYLIIYWTNCFLFPSYLWSPNLFLDKPVRTEQMSAENPL